MQELCYSIGAADCFWVGELAAGVEDQSWVEDQLGLVVGQGRKLVGVVGGTVDDLIELLTVEVVGVVEVAGIGEASAVAEAAFVVVEEAVVVGIGEAVEVGTMIEEIGQEENFEALAASL